MEDGFQNILITGTTRSTKAANYRHLIASSLLYSTGYRHRPYKLVAHTRFWEPCYQSVHALCNHDNNVDGHLSTSGYVLCLNSSGYILDSRTTPSDIIILYSTPEFLMNLHRYSLHRDVDDTCGHKQSCQTQVRFMNSKRVLQRMNQYPYV
jgi:hypothetical protein